MRKSLLALAAIAAVALMGQACTPWGQPANVSNLPSTPPEDAFVQDKMMNDEGVEGSKNADKADAMMEKDDGITPDDGVMEDKDGSEADSQTMTEDSEPTSGTPYYIAYSNTEFNRALEAKKATLLYFWASWCPICQAEEPKIKSAVESSGLNVAGFRVNFDTEDMLKEKFNIPYQHTTVILNTQGVETARFTGPTSNETLLEALRNAAAS